ncbi:unnamed protein product [Microthlaspi erraticum]|uniref:Uncharacterized protein n=1 Tax=Microthlaspi erraticum TaxID=1685480 RepID=A0A6D2JR55_9BRAS|nr:unnamed protein product [Microthlaspi erraticum]
MKVIENWVAEFFLRRQQNPRVSGRRLLSALKSEDVVKLKITAVLRDISNSLIQGKVDEELLDLLEILEKLLRQGDKDSAIMGPHKSAYCCTAVECTLRFMLPMTASEGFFSDALERIWKKRIGELKERKSELVTPELLKWESDLKLAFEEPEMYLKIRESNIRYNAISHLNQILKEQWALLGCSSLESEARKMLLKGKESNANSGESDRIEREARNGTSRGVVNGVEVEEHEASLNNGDKRVARELKDCLLEIQGVIDPSTRQGKETNNVSDQPVDVSRQADRGKRSERGGGQAEGSEGTSSSSSGRVRPHLPTPQPLNVSPLKKNVKRPRRPVKFWSREEEEALTEGVKEHGRAWKYIKNSNPLVFADRTEVDLKDKWRNLLGR